jgi:hypothetical protein
MTEHEQKRAQSELIGAYFIEKSSIRENFS